MIQGLEKTDFPKVFQYFEEISNIPRGSGNTKAISDYIYDFGKSLGLESYQDSTNNVIIIREASSGFENKAAIMLQGHIDMVCERESDCNHDFTKDPLKLYVEDGYLRAKGTTLGADDGIAVAYMMAILSDTTIHAPRLECVFTVDEETGMDGAIAIDLSKCQAKRLINLDSETEGEFTVGCAGGARLNASLPLEFDSFSGKKITITVSGLLGGHSGDAIHLGRGNAVNIISRLLFHLENEVLDFGLISISGGSKDNAIPREANITIATNEPVSKLDELVEGFLNIVKKELGASDTDVKIGYSIDDENVRDYNIISKGCYNGIYAITQAVPNGVIAMSQSIPGLTETSTNLGILEINDNSLNATYLLRSSIDSRKQELLDRMKFILASANIPYTEGSSYPGWPFNPNSPLQSEMSDLWEKMFGKKPVITAIHGGLECGLLCDKVPGIDIVSLGPDNIDIHTPQEHMGIASAERVFHFLTTFISSL